ncbi:MAG: thioesterase family protein [Reyranellaceae bacterium]
MNDLPYELPDLDLSAPLSRFRETVKSEWIDWNGHMNVGYYVILFDRASSVLFDQFGCGPDYGLHKVGLAFVLEAHLTYEREVRAGATIAITSQILAYDAKRLHYFHTMYDSHDNSRVATNELVAINISYHSRRSAPWPDFAIDRIERLYSAHGALPRPSQVGRAVGLRR